MRLTARLVSFGEWGGGFPAYFVGCGSLISGLVVNGVLAGRHIYGDFVSCVIYIIGIGLFFGCILVLAEAQSRQLVRRENGADQQQRKAE
jgi:hypothetical protein